MAAHHRTAWLDPEAPGHRRIRLLDLYSRFGDLRGPSEPRHFRDVDALLAATAAGLWVTGERSDERVDLLDDKRPLARPGLHQAPGCQPLDCVTDGVPRRLVLLPELDLRSELASSRQFARLDLGTQIVGDLPVHGLNHQSSQRSQP